MIREPAVAGRFYPRDPVECRALLLKCIDRARDSQDSLGQNSETKIIGGVVPHAGWICSGAIAARTILEISRGRMPDTVIIFGAVHVPHGARATIFASGAWETPLRLAKIDERLVGRLCGQTSLLEADPHAHEHEHSIEVEVPFIQHLLPDARIVPIMAPPNENAAALGSAVGIACRNYKANVAFLASTDLTHYGPSYGFTSQGVGRNGIEWAKNMNDRRMIDLIIAMQEGKAVSEAMANQNACGPGAVAAAISAAKAVGATRAELLEHTNSYEVLSAISPEPPRDAVGYTAMVFRE